MVLFLTLQILTGTPQEAVCRRSWEGPVRRDVGGNERKTADMHSCKIVSGDLEEFAVHFQIF